MKPGHMEVPVSVVRELRRITYETVGWTRNHEIQKQLAMALASLPAPPDVAQELANMLGDHSARERVRAMIRRYRELGCPELEDT